VFGFQGFLFFSGYFDEQVEADVVKLKVRWLVICVTIRRDGLMVSALVWGSSPRRGHCVVFMGKTLYSHRLSLHPSE